MNRPRGKSLIRDLATDSHSQPKEIKITPYLGDRESSSRRRNSFPKYDKLEIFIDKLTPFAQIQREQLWNLHTSEYQLESLVPLEYSRLVEDLDNDKFLNFRENCQYATQRIKHLITLSNQVIDFLDSISTIHGEIWTETAAFDSVASELLSRQSTYDEKVKLIDSYVAHYTRLDLITKSLSVPGARIVRKPIFRQILKELDESLEFMSSHESFRDLEFYLIRFRQCMTRALTLLKDYLTDELRLMASRVGLRMKMNVPKEVLFYSGFASFLDQSDFFELHEELIKQAFKHPEYTGLVSDVLNVYFKLRINLTRDYANDHLQSAHADLVQSSQDHISFVKRFVEKEFDLMKKFFNVKIMEDLFEEKFNDFALELIDGFYNNTRQFVLKETNISQLCRLATLLQKYHDTQEPEDEVNLAKLFQPVLNDVQSRLIFRVQKYVDNDLNGYKPTAEDSEIVLQHRKTKTEAAKQLDNDYLENLFPGVYLPLAKALTLLSSIYELINSVVFDDLAHYIVHSCIIFLKEYYRSSVKHLGIISSKLNYLKHLEILKSQLNNFDIQYVRNDYSIDLLGGFSELWTDLKNGRLSFDNNSLMDIVKKSVPKIITNMIDANYEIDLELNYAINDFIVSCISELCEPIHDSSALTDLKSTDRFKDNANKLFPKYVEQLKIYIRDYNIRKFLAGRLVTSIVTNYDNFKMKLDSQHRAGQQETTVMETDELVRLLDELTLPIEEQTDEPFELNLDGLLPKDDPKNA